MNTNRLNSFTDGVVAIIITIMVLELPVPKAPGMAALVPLSVLFAAYALAFVKVGIYWAVHHNMLQAARRVDGKVLLANLFLLFWLSLVPFVVRWVGEAGITRDTVLAFGVIMLLCALSVALLRSNPKPTDTNIEQSMGGNLCRCATYVRIREAIKSVSQRLK